MKKNNNNLSCINQKRFNALKKQAGSDTATRILDGIAFMWQISTYKIKNSDKTWFTRTYEDLINEFGVSESTIYRCLRQFENDNLIEKTVKERYSKKHGKDIACLHIRITDKLQEIIEKTNRQSKLKTIDVEENKSAQGAENKQNDGTGSVILTDPTINKGDFLNKTNSIVSEQNNVNFVDKHKSEDETPKPLKKQSYSKITYPIEKDIGERITDELKNLIKGTLYNIQTQHKVVFSNPNQVFAEVVFAMTNEQQIKGLTCVKKRMNIISKLLRMKQWKTPKGFYKYWDIGQMFSDKKELRDKRIKEHKEAEIKASHAGSPDYIDVDEAQGALMDSGAFTGFTSANKQNHERGKQLTALNDKLRAIEEDIFSEGKYLADIQKHYNAGKPCASQELIDAQMNRLAALYEQQTMIEQEIGLQRGDMELVAA